MDDGAILEEHSTLLCESFVSPGADDDSTAILTVTRKHAEEEH